GGLCMKSMRKGRLVSASHFAILCSNLWRRAMPKVSGGCLCGAVRYECSAEPLGTAICHCTHCQKVSGSAFSVNVVVPAPSLTWQGQSLASYATKVRAGNRFRESSAEIVGHHLRPKRRRCREQ